VEVSAQLFVDWGSQWSYFKGISEPSQPIDLWRTAGFNATGWAVGNAPFRYGDGTGGTLLTDMLGKYTTFYIRKEIFVETLDNIDELRIDVDYDDGFVLWINGVQILQSNVPSNYAYTQGAINSHESGEFERYTLRKEQLPLAEGANLIAVQGFNLSKSSSDFYLDLKMEGGKCGKKYLFALRPLPKSPLGRHNSSDGCVSPSENVRYSIFLSFSPHPESPLGRH